MGVGMAQGENDSEDKGKDENDDNDNNENKENSISKKQCFLYQNIVQ